MKLKRHEPGKVMRDASFVRAALNEALAEGDMEAFKEILRGHYEALNITQALEKANVSRRTYYEAVSPRGNPRLSTVMRLMKGLEA
jgi:probable addiction module antidote protein